jgi:adenylate cyclase
VRVRIKGDKGFITVKGISSDSGMSRFEWEKEIPIDEAENLLKLCEKGIIDKIRFNVKIGNHTFEVDEFHGENEGLIIAEIELNSENEVFERPNWLGEEVTNDKRYYNSYLSNHPFKNW